MRYIRVLLPPPHFSHFTINIAIKGSNSMKMDKEYISGDIWKIEDFITEEECAIIMSDCIKEDGWFGDPGAFENGNKSLLSEEAKDVLDKINLRIISVIDNEKEKANAVAMIQRMTTLSGPNEIWALPPHTDTHDGGDSMYVTRGYVLYYNDDFDGGEIEYVNQNKVIKPKSRMLISHPGTEDYLHGIKKVTKGTRYMTTGFVFDIDFWFKRTLGK